MHAGNNYAKITFSSVYETKVLEIYAHKGEKQKSKEQKEHAKIRECQSGLVELYEAFRLKKIVTGVWANESVERLNQLHASGSGDVSADESTGTGDQSPETGSGVDS